MNCRKEGSLLGIPYSFLEGPQDIEILQTNQTPEVTNCQRFVQWWLWQHFNIALKPDDLLLPRAYHKTGKLVWESGNNLESLRMGDLMYAVRRKESKNVMRQFPDPELRRHVAVFLGQPTLTAFQTIYPTLTPTLNSNQNYLVHASYFDKQSCIIPWETFTDAKHYQPMRARRIIN